jgi:hypothetical protein
MMKRLLGVFGFLAPVGGILILTFWVLSAFIRMAISLASTNLGDIIFISILVAFTAVFLWFIVQTIIQWVRAGKQPTKEQRWAAFSAIASPVFNVICAGFIGACIASTIVVIELNAPFTKEAIDRMVQEHTTLFWAVVGAGLIFGAGGRIWSLSRPGQVAGAQKEQDAGASEGDSHTHRT